VPLDTFLRVTLNLDSSGPEGRVAQNLAPRQVTNGGGGTCLMQLTVDSSAWRPFWEVEKQEAKT
jgi:hypothetical protein